MFVVPNKIDGEGDNDQNKNETLTKHALKAIMSGQGRDGRYGLASCARGPKTRAYARARCMCARIFAVFSARGRKNSLRLGYLYKPSVPYVYTFSKDSFENKRRLRASKIQTTSSLRATHHVT